MKMKQNFFILNAYPGHGKDFTLSLLAEITKTDFTQIQLALKAKEIIAESLPSKFLTDISMNKVMILNNLKDKKMDTKVLGNCNMRNLLQIILGDVFRTINPEINILFTLKKLEEQLSNNSTNFICTDNRYRNEQEFLYPLTKLSTNEEKIDYLRWRISNSKTKFTNVQILEIFDELTQKIIIDNKDISMLNKIKMYFLNENEKLNSTLEPINQYNELINSINFNNIGNMSKEQGIENGLIHIFRPILPIGEMCDEKDLIKRIIDYTKFQEEDVLFIKNNYERYQIDFNSININKYGFLRADPNHLSERDLDGRKPEPFFNIPLHLKDNLSKQLTSCLLEKKNNRVKKIKHT